MSETAKTNEIAWKIKTFRVEDLSGNWSLGDIQKMVLQFNTLQPQKDKERGNILYRLCGAHLIRHVLYNRNSIVMVPERLVQKDLCTEQFNDAARTQTIESFFNPNLHGKIVPGEMERYWKEAEDRAEKSGKLPRPYVRKYPETPPLLCDVEESAASEHNFVIRGYKHLFKSDMLVWRLPVMQIIQLQLDETDRTTGLSEYVDLKIVF